MEQNYLKNEVKRGSRLKDIHNNPDILEEVEGILKKGMEVFLREFFVKTSDNIPKFIELKQIPIPMIKSVRSTANTLKNQGKHQAL